MKERQSMNVRINTRQKIAMDDDDETITAAELSAGTPRKKSTSTKTNSFLKTSTKTNSFLNSPFARPHHLLPFLTLPNLPSTSIALYQGQFSNQNAPACMPNRKRRPFSLFITDRLVSNTFAFSTGLENAPRLGSRP